MRLLKQLSTECECQESSFRYLDTDVTVSEGRVCISQNEIPWEEHDKVTFFLTKIKGTGRFDISFERTGTDIVININELLDSDFAKSKDLWHVNIEVESHQNKTIYQIRKGDYGQEGTKSGQIWDKRSQFIKGLGSGYQKNGQAVLLYWSESRILSVCSVRESLQYQKQVQGKVLFAKVKGNVLHYRCKVPRAEDLVYLTMRLVYRTDKAEDEKYYEYPIHLVRENRSHQIYDTRIDLKAVKLRPVFWEFHLMIRTEQGEYAVALVNRSYLNYAKYCSLFFHNAYEYGDGMFAYPYVAYDRTMPLQYREKGRYDDYRIKLKERLAVLRVIFTYPILKKKKIFLVFEKFSMMAQDNGYYFFRYCMEEKMEQKMGCHIYYVIDSQSPDYKKLEPYKDHVIEFMSIRHIVYALTAKALISTDAKTHVYPWRRKGSVLIPFIKKRKLLFLQHGVTAFKQVDFFYGKGKSGECDAFVVTSDFEKEIVQRNFGYQQDQIPVTGFSRWDVLEDQSQNSREILVCPTWRVWLDECTDDVFVNSEYYKNYTEFLQSERLLKLLKKYDVRVNFYLHSKFREYIKDFDVRQDRIRLLPFGSQPLNETMMKSRMLITDYSSVAWDMYYMKKPVIFFQFDLDDYLKMHGSYMKMPDELFGPQAVRTESLLDELEKCMQTQFKLSQAQEEAYPRYFKYVDHKNSERLCEYLMNVKW